MRINQSFPFLWPELWVQSTVQLVRDGPLIERICLRYWLWHWVVCYSQTVHELGVNDSACDNTIFTTECLQYWNAALEQRNVSGSKRCLNSCNQTIRAVGDFGTWQWISICRRCNHTVICPSCGAGTAIHYLVDWESAAEFLTAWTNCGTPWAARAPRRSSASRRGSNSNLPLPPTYTFGRLS